MELSTVKIASLSTGLLFASLPKSLGTAVAYSSTPLNRQAKAYFLRRDRDDTRNVVNIFDDHGDLVYTLVRMTGGSTGWSMFAEPHHTPVATVKIGLLGRQIQTATGNLRLRPATGVRGKMHRHFFDSESQVYAWNRRSHYLERISAHNLNHAEHRQVLGMAKQLRTYHFDWEVIIDEQAANELSPVVLLASAFISIKTQWAFPRSTTNGRVGVGSSQALSDDQTGPVLPTLWTPNAKDESFNILNEAVDLILGSPLVSPSSPASPPFTPVSSKFASPTGFPPLPLATLGFINNDLQKLAVFSASEPTDIPREFFNPPKFMKDAVAIPN